MRADVEGQLHILVRYRTRFWILKIDPSNPPQGTFWGDGSGAHQDTYHLGTHGELLAYASDKNGNLAVASTGPGPDSDIIHYVPLSAQPADGASAGVTTWAIPFQNHVELAYDLAGNLYLVDAKYEDPDPNDISIVRVSEMRVVKIAPDGTTTTLLNGFPDRREFSDTATPFRHRFGLVVDASGNVYVSDPFQHVVYRISSSGQLTLFAGKPGEAGNAD